MHRLFKRLKRQKPTKASPPVLFVDIPDSKLSIDASRVVPASAPMSMSQPSSPALYGAAAAAAAPTRRMTAPPAVSAFHDGGNGGGSSSRSAMLRSLIPGAIQLGNDFRIKRYPEVEEREEREEIVEEEGVEEVEEVEEAEEVEEVEEVEEKRSEFLELPNELMLAIAELLPVSSISALLQCNRRFSLLLELTLYRTAVRHSGYGKSMFCRCIETGNTRSTLRMLELGADVNSVARTGDGRTPLHYAVKSKNPSIVKAILEKQGVKLDVVDTSQTPSTPLSLAVGEGHEEIVKQLLDAGADPRKPPVAKECYKKEFYNGANRGILGVIRSLIDHGLSVDYADSTGNTFLHSAATFGNLAAVDMLLSCGASAAVANVNGVIPLYRAAEDNYLDVALLLLPKMRSPGACDAATRYGATSLHAAVKKNHRQFARLLMVHGAELDVQDNDGNTPLHAAALWGLKDMAQLLLEMGARARIRNSVGFLPSEVVDGETHTELKRILEEAEYRSARCGAESDDDGDSSADSMVVHCHDYQDVLFPGSRSAARLPFP